MKKTLFITFSFTIFFCLFFTNLQYGSIHHSENLAFLIKYEYPGSDAETIEKLIATEVENRLFQIENISEVKSTSQMNQTSITATFNSNADFSSTYLNISEIIDQLKHILPSDIPTPVIMCTESNIDPIICIAFNTTKEAILQIKAYFNSIEGVAEVHISGQEKSPITIQFDDEKLAQLNLLPTQLTYLIQQFNKQDISIRPSESEEFTYFNFNNILNEKDLRNLKIPVNNSFIPLSEIAQIQRMPVPVSELVLLNNTQTTLLTIKPDSNSNWIKISNKTNQLLKQKDISCFNPIIIYDEGKNEKQSFSSALLNLIILFFILTFVVFLVYKNSILTVICPFILLLTIIWTFGTFSFLSIPITSQIISSLSFALGLIIDIPIFIISSSQNNIPRNFKSFISNIIKELLFSQITTIIVLLGLLILKDTYYDFYIFSISILYMIIYSTVITLLLIPVILKCPANKYHTITKSLFEKIQTKTINFSYIFFVIISITAIFSSLLLLSLIPKEINLYTNDKILSLTIDYPPEESISNIQKNLSPYLEKLKIIKEINYTKTKISKGHSEIEIIFNSKPNQTTLNNIDSLTSCITYGTVHFSQNKAQQYKQLQLGISGWEHEKCQNYVIELSKILLSNPSIKNVILNFKDPEKQILFKPDPHQLITKNININAIGQNLRVILNGIVVTKIFIENKEEDILLKSNISNLLSKLMSQNLSIEDSIKSISSIGNFITTNSSTIRNKINGTPCSYFTVEYTGDFNTILNLINDAFYDLPHETGYIIQTPLLYKNFEANYNNLTLILITCIIFLFIFIHATTESLKKTLYIFLSIPILLVIPLFVTFISNNKLNLGVLNGLILICGIGINNTIISLSNRNTKISKFETLLITTITTILSSSSQLFIDADKMTRSLSMTMIIGTITSFILAIILLLTKTDLNKKKPGSYLLSHN